MRGVGLQVQVSELAICVERITKQGRGLCESNIRVHLLGTVNALPDVLPSQRIRQCLKELFELRVILFIVYQEIIGWILN